MLLRASVKSFNFDLFEKNLEIHAVFPIKKKTITKSLYLYIETTCFYIRHSIILFWLCL